MTDQEKDRKETENKNSKGDTENIHGRLDNTANPDYLKEEEIPDISQVDRQEGTMNNGELGGNFKEEANENS